MSISTRSDMDSPRNIMVAVDFGTTYSGIAWAQSERPTAQHIIKSWPDQTYTDEEDPTTITYDGYPEYCNYRWGTQIDEFEPKYEWFKLGLDPKHGREPSSLAYRYTSPSLPPPGPRVSSEKLITDYLTALRKHAISILEEKLTVGLVQRTPIEFVVTVPAIWQEKTKEKMVQCAKNAGMAIHSSLHIISEPEAAAVYELSARSNLGLQVGDTFVICDAGGGTVDLISYTITSLNPPVVQEAAPGAGAECCSTFLNRIFAEYMNERFAHDRAFDEKTLAEAVKKFDTDIKRRFHRGYVGTFSVPMYKFRDDVAEGISRGRLRLPKERVERIYEPVVSEIIRLIKDQIAATNRHIKSVLLVGGFGESIYLKERIGEELGPRTAVRQGIEPEANQFVGGYHIKAMNWFIKMNDSIKEAVPRLVPWSWDQKVSLGRPGMLRIMVYNCSSRIAPVDMTNDASKFVEVTANLGTIPESRINRERGTDGSEYYQVDFDIEVTCYRERIEFTLVYAGKRYDAVTKEYM